MTKFATALLVAAAAFSMPAFAQETVSVTLKVDSGTVMASSGGEYVSASDGQTLVSGQSIMVNEGSQVTLTYGKNCKMQFTLPGTYTIPSECKAPASNDGSGGSSLMNGVIIIASAVVAAGGIESEDNVPVSLSSRP